MPIEQILLAGIKDGLIWYPLVLGIGLIYNHFREIDISIDGIAIGSGIIIWYTWQLSGSYTMSVFAGIIFGSLIASINAIIIEKFKVNPLMSGLVISLVIHSISLIVIGESEKIKGSSLFGSMTTVPPILVVIVIVIFLLSIYYYNSLIGLQARKYGYGIIPNTGRSGLKIRIFSYGLSGALYGLGTSIYVHTNGMVSNGGSFEFLVVSICSFLIIDKVHMYLINNLKKKIFSSLQNIINGVFKKFNSVWKKKISTKINYDVPLKALMGSIIFQVIIAFTIFIMPNLWKLVFSVMLLFLLIEFRFVRRNKSYQTISTAENQLTIKNLNFSYEGNNNLIFSNSNFTFGVGLNLIKGVNASGKTTLLKILAGELFPIDGYCNYKRQNLFHISAISRPIYFVRQNSLENNAQNMTVFENIGANVNKNYLTLPSKINNSMMQKINKSDIISNSRLKQFFIKNRNSIALKLSGGQNQLLALLQSLLSDKEIILIDEPTTGLDDKFFNEIRDILCAMSKNRIIVITSHDNRIGKFCDNIYSIHNKQVMPGT